MYRVTKKTISGVPDNISGKHSGFSTLDLPDILSPCQTFFQGDVWQISVVVHYFVPDNITDKHSAL